MTLSPDLVASIRRYAVTSRHTSWTARDVIALCDAIIERDDVLRRIRDASQADLDAGDPSGWAAAIVGDGPGWQS